MKIPELGLLDDVVTKTAVDEIEGREEVVTSSAIVFSDSQLDVYGIFELQTLEEVLRNDHAGSQNAKRDASNSIKKKIDWKDNG